MLEKDGRTIENLVGWFSVRLVFYSEPPNRPAICGSTVVTLHTESEVWDAAIEYDYYGTCKVTQTWSDGRIECNDVILFNAVYLHQRAH